MQDISSEHHENKTQHPWDETIRTVLIAVLLAVVFRSFAFEPFHIPSGSMKDNLLVGDYLFVSKYEYGYSRYSFPFGPPLFKGRIMENHKPQRGDVVVFSLPIDTRISYIKRIIGMPGDRIQVKNGLLYINGEALKQSEDGTFLDDEDKDNIKSVPKYAETLPEGKVIHILKRFHINSTPIDPGHTADETAIYTVPPAHYFMMGDNRDNSRDSRWLDEVGYVPEENIVGRAEMIFFSIDTDSITLNPGTWMGSLRFQRFFKHVD